MVTSPHALASESGARILRDGGNALDAAIAIGATIAVVYPHFCGLGGDAVWIVAGEEGRKDCFLGIGQSASILPGFDCDIPLRGQLSMLTSACAVDAWRHAHDYSVRNWGGGLSFSSLLDDAIGYAEDGFKLAARGHVLSPIDRLSPLSGQAGIIARQEDGSLAGARDPRGDGVALLVEPTR
ncbi:hypothetical protein ELH73_32410 [Rhizobium leguminosarum]|uniref:Gamma-glutamyltransferase n=1 Tax=Rhizobium leguminosarum TaxID=384 RepID=A0ABD7PHA6_RHILE|nr:gamma-glutamyltransferase [Rhizobium leguminosarum]TAV64336.1 hypothetical protein ELI28_31290 [Rhizobium leguminosarum]TAV66329.1 hypothetical protein ELI27_29040 [Rhizobium leguminosarum]TAW19293.1 hypothetical protein ELI19_29235 [Rhizobium leguminosarum]TAW33070.1 hypothetical protein ELI18_31280 [Rhizobium leguminosarum]TAZ23929.1 hypothetical protein ELH73_32410 [Rhizobium leguminosarum]